VFRNDELLAAQVSDLFGEYTSILLNKVL